MTPMMLEGRGGSKVVRPSTWIRCVRKNWPSKGGPSLGSSRAATGTNPGQTPVVEFGDLAHRPVHRAVWRIGVQRRVGNRRNGGRQVGVARSHGLHDLTGRGSAGLRYQATEVAQHRSGEQERNDSLHACIFPLAPRPQRLGDPLRYGNPVTLLYPTDSKLSVGQSARF